MTQQVIEESTMADSEKGTELDLSTDQGRKKKKKKMKETERERERNLGE